MKKELKPHLLLLWYSNIKTAALNIEIPKEERTLPFADIEISIRSSKAAI